MLALPPPAALIAGLVGAAVTPGVPSGAPPDGSPPAETAAIDRAWAGALERASRDAARGEFRVDHSSWNDPWTVRSDHYEVRTTQGRGYGLGRAQDLEQMLARFQDVLGTDFVPRTPFTVLVHPTLELYREYGDANSDARSSIFGGFYDPQNPGGAIATLYDANLTLERMFLTHAATQQYVDRAFSGVQPPAAMTQGLGAYFQASWNYGYFVDRFEVLRDEVEGRELIPLSELLGASLNDYAERTDDRFFQLGMLFVYLRSVRADTRSTVGADGRIEVVGPFDDYVRRSIRGQAVDDHPVHALLTESVDDLDAEIRAFRGWR